MNGAIRYLQTRKEGNGIFFRCLPEKVDALIITVQPNAPFSITDEVLENGLPEEHFSFVVAKRQDLPYVGERKLVIESLIKDGFEESSAQIFEQAKNLYEQVTSV